MAVPYKLIACAFVMLGSLFMQSWCHDHDCLVNIMTAQLVIVSRMTAMTFNERMKFARERIGLSHTDAAKSIGCGRTTVIRWETEGQSVHADFLMSAARAYKVDPDWLTMKKAKDGFPWESVERPSSPSLATNTTSPPVAVSPPETDSDYVRVEQIDAVGGMGDGVINSDNPEVIRSVEYGAAFIRSLVGFMPPPGRLKLVTGTGDSMRGMIEPGEVLLMDTGVSSFEGDGIYWIGLGDEHDGLQVKMLQRRGDGIYVVSANPFYPEFIFPPDGRIGGKLYIKHKLERFN